MLCNRVLLVVYFDMANVCSHMPAFGVTPKFLKCLFSSCYLHKYDEKGIFDDIRAICIIFNHSNACTSMLC